VLLAWIILWLLLVAAVAVKGAVLVELVGLELERRLL
jgi:hypothetical protein